MSQFDPVIGADKSGLAYRQDDNNGKRALLNHHKAPTPPPYAEAGMMWIDDSNTPWLLKTFDGSDWIAMGAIDAGLNTFEPYNQGAPIGLASTSSAGLAERATASEVRTGTDTTRFITPNDQVLILLDTIEAVDDSSLAITNHIDSNYKNYVVRATNVTVSNNNNILTLAASTNGGSPYLSSYERSSYRVSSAATTVLYSNSSGASSIFVANGLGNGSDQSLNFTVSLFNPSTSNEGRKLIKTEASFFDTNNRTVTQIGTHAVSTTDAINAIRFSLSGTISGTFKLYGVK